MGFETLQENVLNEIDGGITVLGACAAIVAVGGALKICYELGECTGEFIYNVTH